MSDFSDSFEQLSNLGAYVAAEKNRRTLVAGFVQSALYAQKDAQYELRVLNEACGHYGSGNNMDFDVVSRQAHMTAFGLMTYAEVCAVVGALPQDDCQRLMTAGRAMQSRALHHEAFYLSDALSPSDVFYDDLVCLAQLQVQHSAVAFSEPGDSDSLNNVVEERFLHQHSSVPVTAG